MIPKSTILIDIQYFANYNYYKLLLDNTYVLFDPYVRHLKKNYANRCILAGANGEVMLSIPLQKGRGQKSGMKDVRIANDTEWQRKHLRSIISAYNSSPWFTYYHDSLSLLFSEKYEYLAAWDIACTEWILQQLKLRVGYGFTTGFQRQVEKDGIADYRHFILPGKPMPETDKIRYQQVFEERTGFIPGLSILDMLFCTGPERVTSLLTKQR